MHITVGLKFGHQHILDLLNRFLSYLCQIRSVSDGHSVLIEKAEQNLNNQRTLEGNVAHIFAITLNKAYSQDI